MIICGMDEVGRGALAGPLVGAATISNFKYPISNIKLRDSKVLNKDARIRIYEEIVHSGAIIKVESISVRLINKYGIGWANKEIFRRLILKMEADQYIVDGNLKIKIKNKEVLSLVKADSQIPEVMAASIVAKVTRDRLMQKIHFNYLNYGWDSNVGYGTQKHIQALKLYGSCRHHRTMFVETVLNKFQS